MKAGKDKTNSLVIISQSNYTDPVTAAAGEVSADFCG
jgi:hypothetical protein